MDDTRLSKQKWISIITFALLGQVAWVIENQFLNLFMDRTISTNAFAISFMVSASAIIATVTTLFMGIKTDRKGKRVPFITWGYVIWGISIMAFSLITVKNISTFFRIEERKAVAVAVISVVVLDCVMTFIGSTANDASFNAWVTDNTTTNTRGKVEGVLSIMAGVATALVFGFDLIGGFTQNKYYDAHGNQVASMVDGGSVVFGNWTLFFCLFGAMVIVAGLIGKRFVKDSPELKPNSQSSYRNVLYGFKPSIMKKYKMFYLCLSAMVVLGIAGNVTGPYILIYMERTLGFKNFIIPYGIATGIAGLMSILLGIWLDRKGKKIRFLVPGMMVSIIGNILLFFVSPSFFEKTSMSLFIAVSCINSIGGILTGIVLGATLRDYTPKSSVGQFQGVRMVFCVMLPMCIGPFLTAFLNVSGISNQAGTDAFGNEIYNYSPVMFLLCAVVTAVAIIPGMIMTRSIVKNQSVQHN